MRFVLFRKRMRKALFTWGEARTVAFETPPPTLKLQLHMWTRAGNLVSVRRGVYAFADSTPTTREILEALYPPSYVSLESALSLYGTIPDVPFTTTAVTPRPSRTFSTPWGTFRFRRIRTAAFLGFDPETSVAIEEKAVVDFLFFNRRRFTVENAVWQKQRWHHLKELDFSRARKYARLFNSRPLLHLVRELEAYAATHDVD